MLREAHRSQFSPALEVAGSGVGERPSSPLRVNRIFSAMSALSPVFPQERTLAASAISSGKWVGGEGKYFCKRGWTNHFGKHEVICPSGKTTTSVNYQAGSAHPAHCEIRNSCIPISPRAH